MGGKLGRLRRQPLGRVGSGMTAAGKTEALVLAMAETIGLEISPEALPGVVAFFETARDHAVLLEQIELDDATLDLAPVFRLPAGTEDAG